MSAQDFRNAYREAAVWSSSTDDGAALDSLDAELSREAVETMGREADEFFDAHAETWRAAGMTDEQAGHDFWLTRCGHGSGFWDRDLPDDAGDVLTAVAHACGERNLYVGDDGLIHHTFG